MNIQKLLFIICIFLILILLFVTHLDQKPIIKGKISKVKYGNGKISLYMENNQTEIILFTAVILNLQEKDKITVYGKYETYKNKKQIIANKIILKSFFIFI